MPEAASADQPTTSDAPQSSGLRILLDGVTKRYGVRSTPAVDNVTLEIGAGEIVMLVGPSGCGKTTTMKVINRLIEPTSGRIFIGDDDVTRRNPDELRRHIGYVVQGAGVFLHLTVGDNIGIVPRLLKWDKNRVAARIDELLDLVNLDPAQYRDRFPRELSGGQQQRVGVARALAADPPVLLMDEPFGAVDPITRQRLQDELLRLQEELHKTIVFVTHDFGEAVKLGDRIAILTTGSKVVQYDTPERVLAEPANDFVRGFVGAGATLMQLSLTRVRDIDLHEAVVAQAGGDPAEAVELAGSLDRAHAIVLDRQNRPLRWLPLEELAKPQALAQVTRDDDLECVNLASTLNDALDEMLTSAHGVVVVTGRRNTYQGVIRVETIMEQSPTYAVQRTLRSPTRERGRQRHQRRRCRQGRRRGPTHGPDDARSAEFRAVGAAATHVCLRGGRSAGLCDGGRCVRVGAPLAERVASVAAAALTPGDQPVGHGAHVCGGDSGGNRIDARTEAALFEADHHRRQFRSGRAGYRPDRAGGGRVRDRSARRDRCPHRLRRDPIIANTVTGLDGVDRRIVEAARGMGLSAFSTLRRVELPLSLPVIVAGVRTAWC